MKRRELVLASAGILAAASPLRGRSATPCPPPIVTVAGGTTASTACPTLSTSTYSTRFPVSENPLSEGGKWINGGAQGLDWQDVQATAGLAYSSNAVSGYNDCIACLPGISGNRHFVQATVHRRSGYVAPSTHEVELLVGWDIANRNARGYEFLFSLGGGMQGVRWNGALNDFTVNGSSTSNNGSNKPWTDVGTGTGVNNLLHGDVIKVVFDATSGSPMMTLFRNAVQVLQIRDTSAFRFPSGQPGIGFFARPGAGLELSAYSFSEVVAGIL